MPMIAISFLALLMGTLRQPESLRSPQLSVEALSQALVTQHWPTFELTVEHPHFPRALCDLSFEIDRGRSVLVLGDTRADRAGLGPSARWHSLSAQALKKNPALLIHLGDWVTQGDDVREWQYALEAALALKRPILTVRGNHDRGPYWSRFELDGLKKPLPRPAQLRVTRMGKILVYLFDTEAEEDTARAVLEAHLKTRIDQEFCFIPQQIIWIQHRPIWSRGPHGSDERGWASWLVPALEQLKVQLLLAGHDHNYERMKRTRGVGKDRIHDPQGILYLTSGGAGAVTTPFPDLSRRTSLNQKRYDRALSEVFSSASHYLLLSMSSEGLHVEAWASPREGRSEIFDEFWLQPLQ